MSRLVKSMTFHMINNSGSVYFGPSTQEMVWHHPWNHGSLVVNSSSNMELTVTDLINDSPDEIGARHATRPHSTRRRTRALLPPRSLPTLAARAARCVAPTILPSPAAEFLGAGSMNLVGGINSGSGPVKIATTGHQRAIRTRHAPLPMSYVPRAQARRAGRRCQQWHVRLQERQGHVPAGVGEQGWRQNHPQSGGGGDLRADQLAWREGRRGGGGGGGAHQRRKL